MVCTYRKGNRTQQKAKKFYESQGYQVEIVRRDKYRKDQDFFGLWDLICIGPHDVKVVQVKTNAKPDKEWMEKAEKWVCPKAVIREYVVYRDYQRGNAPSARVTFGPSY